MAALNRIAKLVESEHGLVLSSLTDALDHAEAAGRALLEAKEMVPAEEWDSWVADRGMQLAESVTYMQLAKDRAMTGEAKEMASAFDFGMELSRTFMEAQHAKWKEQYAAGMSCAKIRQEALESYSKAQERAPLTFWIPGFNTIRAKDVMEVVDPARWKKERVKWQRRAAEQRANEARIREAAAEAKRREDRRVAAKRSRKSCPALANSYSNIRLALDELRSHVEPDPDAKAAIEDALHALYRAEDAISRAIGTTKAMSAKAVA